MVDSTTTGAGGSASALGCARRGESFGRYLVLEEVGRGGMGVVYSAFDPDLDRRVALKVWAGTGEPDERRTRLLAEAKALARLSHPNVVTVFDVGQRDDAVYIAMELLHGGTLDEWLSTSPPVEARLRAFELAGQGLAAAHRAGLCHGDFKPGNVLRTMEGGIKVADFGLAVGVQASAASPDSVAGTPRYMAPELQAGGGATPASDQFAFCVAVIRGLGDGGDGAESLPSTLSRPLIEALRRGASEEPEQRHASMDPLLAALAPATKARRQRMLLVLGLSAGAVAVALVGAQDSESPPCSGAAGTWQGLWDAGAQEALHGVAALSEKPFAEANERRIAVTLDAYVERWTGAHREACTRATGPEDALYARRLHCLERAQWEARTLLDQLMTHASAWSRGVQAARSLSDPHACTTEVSSELELAPPAVEDASRVEAARDLLAEARVHELLGQHDQGLELLGPPTVEAERLGYEPLLAELLLRKGRLLEGRGDAREAISTLKEAYWKAQSVRHHGVAAEAATLVAFVFAGVLREHDFADDWVRHGRLAVDFDGTRTKREAELLNVSGVLSMERGEYEKARRDFERSLELKVLHWGPEHHEVATQTTNLAILMEREGDYDAAQQHYQRAKEITVAAFGLEHPRTARCLYNLAIVAMFRGDAGECVRRHREALKLKLRVLGPGHPSLALSYDGLGQCESKLERFEQAQAHHETALRILEEAYGPEHLAVGGVAVNLGNVLRATGDLEGARENYEKGLRILETGGGPDHIDAAAAVTGLALVETSAEHWDEAEAYFRRSRAILLRTVGEEHRSVLEVDSNLAKVVANGGDDQAAKVIAEAALERAGSLPAADPRRRELESIVQTLAAGN